MKTKGLLGISFILLAFIISINNFTITGAVVGNSLSNSFGFIALGFLIVGLVLIMQEGGLEKKAKKIINEIDQDLKNGKVGTYKDVKYYATRLGYELKEGGNHTSIYNHNHLITQIPRHSGDLAKGTYRSILKELRSSVQAA